MKINILPIVSSLHSGDIITEETHKLLSEIESASDFSFEISTIRDLYKAPLSIILVQSGGSEGSFLQMEKDLNPPYYLLTYGNNNSLAASMEILSYLKNKGEESEILHGSPEYIVARLNNLMKKEVNESIKLGVIGKPSDWLIASNVNYDKCLKRFNINLIDIDMRELLEIYNEISLGKYIEELLLDFNQAEINLSKKLSKAIDIIIKKYDLKGITIRCFDLLDTIKTTGCLSLALLNSENSIGTCEGDIPAMLSMHFLKEIIGKPGFQANPSRIDSENNEIVFAHCTLPLDMADSYKVMTHYESGIGVAFRGKLKEGDVTIFKLSNNLVDYYVAEGKLISNLEESNLCRTQINIKLEDTSYFLNAPYGNHHIIVYGKHKEAINQFFEKKFEKH